MKRKNSGIDRRQPEGLFGKNLAKTQFQDYHPGLLSDYKIKLIDLNPSKRSKIKAINKLVMDVNIAQRIAD